MPPIIHEKPPKPPRRSLWQAFSGLLRLRSHARNLSARVNTLESELRDTQAANKALRLRGKDLKTQLVELTRAFDDCDEERAKLARKLTDAAIAWAPIAQWARECLGNDAELPAIASYVADRLKQPYAGENAVPPVSWQSDQSPAPLGQNPESEIAPGHNPDGLTVAQVGEGWRLLTENEIKERAFSDVCCEGWQSFYQDWQTNCLGVSFACTYRVRI